MKHKIYAVVNLNQKKLFVGEAAQLTINWPPLLARLNSRRYSDIEFQVVWNQEADKRYFSFHTWQDLTVRANSCDLLGLPNCEN